MDKDPNRAPSPPEEDECKHGLAITSCSWCKPESVSGRRYNPDDGPVTIAEYESRCPGCRSRISRGDPIHKTDEGWLCEECP